MVYSRFLSFFLFLLMAFTWHQNIWQFGRRGRTTVWRCGWCSLLPRQMLLTIQGSRCCDGMVIGIKQFYCPRPESGQQRVEESRSCLQIRQRDTHTRHSCSAHQRHSCAMFCHVFLYLLISDLGVTTDDSKCNSFFLFFFSHLVIKKCDAAAITFSKSCTYSTSRRSGDIFFWAALLLFHFKNDLKLLVSLQEYIIIRRSWSKWISEWR